MIAIKMSLTFEAVGLMPLPGMTREDAEKQLTEENKANLAEGIQADWRESMKKSGFELQGGSAVEVELVEV